MQIKQHQIIKMTTIENKLNATEIIEELAGQHITNDIVNAAKGKYNKKAKCATIADEISACFDFEQFIIDASTKITELINRKVEEAVNAYEKTNKGKKQNKKGVTIAEEEVNNNNPTTNKKRTTKKNEEPQKEQKEQKETEAVAEKPIKKRGGATKQKTKEVTEDEEGQGQGEEAAPKEITDVKEEPKKKRTPSAKKQTTKKETEAEAAVVAAETETEAVVAETETEAVVAETEAAAEAPPKKKRTPAAKKQTTEKVEEKKEEIIETKTNKKTNKKHIQGIKDKCINNDKKNKKCVLKKIETEVSSDTDEHDATFEQAHTLVLNEEQQHHLHELYVNNYAVDTKKTKNLNEGELPPLNELYPNNDDESSIKTNDFIQSLSSMNELEEEEISDIEEEE